MRQDRSVARSEDLANVRAQRRSVAPPYSTRSAGASEERGPQRPDLVPHLVEEPLPGVGVGRAERGGLVHHDAGRAEQAGLAAEQPGGELEVVVPQEVVGLRQAPLPAQAGVHQDRHERRRADGQAARGRRRLPLPFARKRLYPGSVHRMRTAVRPHHPAGDQRGRAAGMERTGVEHGPQGARLRHRVVVHQPDQVGLPGQGQRQAIREAARAAGVALRRGQPHGREAGPDQVRGAVGGGVVDHDHRVRGAGLPQHRGQCLGQQVPPVIGDDDGDHPGRPARRGGRAGGGHPRSASGPGSAPWPARSGCAAAAPPGNGRSGPAPPA